MSPVLQTLGNEITDEVNALIAESDRFRDPNSPAVENLRRRIEKLQKVSARQAFVRFGSLAAICGDIEGVRDYHRKALFLGEQDATNAEFFTSYGNVGAYQDAQRVGSALLDLRRQQFPKVWQNAVSLGLVLSVSALLPEAKRIWPDLADVDFSFLDRAATVMRDYQLTDKDLGEVLDLMGVVQQSHRTMFAGTLACDVKVVSAPDEPAYLFLAMSIDAGVDEVHAMNRELGRAIVKNAGAFPYGMVATFTKAEPAALRTAA